MVFIPLVFKTDFLQRPNLIWGFCRTAYLLLRFIPVVVFVPIEKAVFPFLLTRLKTPRRWYTSEQSHSVHMSHWHVQHNALPKSPLFEFGISMVFLPRYKQRIDDKVFRQSYIRHVTNSNRMLRTSFFNLTFMTHDDQASYFCSKERFRKLKFLVFLKVYSPPTSLLRLLPR